MKMHTSTLHSIGLTNTPHRTQGVLKKLQRGSYHKIKRQRVEVESTLQKTSTTPPTMLSHLSHTVSVYTCIYMQQVQLTHCILQLVCVPMYLYMHCTSWDSNAYGGAWCTVYSHTIEQEEQREPQHHLCSFPLPVCVYVCCVHVCRGRGERMGMWCACYSPLLS